MYEEPQPSVGRIVHYVLPDGPSAGEHRPAIIVRVQSPTCVQLQVFTDGGNDGPDYASGLAWRTSVVKDDSAVEGGRENHWHWPEYVAPAATQPAAQELVEVR